jgi:hypothetical protein
LSPGDEGKPRCQNCSTRNVTCSYSDFTFVPQGPRLSIASNRSRGYALDDLQTFIVGTAAQTSSPALGVVSPQQSEARGPPPHNYLPSPPIARSPGPVQVRSSIAEQSLDDDDDPTTTWASIHSGERPTYEATTVQRWTDGSISQQGLNSSISVLLRFRYEVVPWIDSNNCKSTFGPTIITLARDNKVISDCIAYCMWVRDGGSSSSGVTSEYSSARRTISELLTQERALTADVGHALLAMSDVYCKPPSQWAHISTTFGRSSDEAVSRSPIFGSTPEPLKTLLRLQLKIGKPILALQCPIAAKSWMC